MDSTQLLLPLALWDRCPEHYIHTISVDTHCTDSTGGTNKQPCVVTGSSTGELVLWRHNEGEDERPLVPRCMLLGHSRAAVLCTLSGFLHKNERCFLSSTADGLLTVWSAAGGHSLSFTDSVPLTPTQVLGVNLRPAEEQDRGFSHVVCVGDCAQVVLLGLASLNVVHILRHASNVLWACVLQDPGRVVTLCEDGTLTFWMLNDLLGGEAPLPGCIIPGEQFLYAHGLFPLTHGRVAGRRAGDKHSDDVCSAACQFLVLRDNAWAVCAVDDKDRGLRALLHTVTVKKSEEGSVVGGAFLEDSELVLVWTTSVIKAYSLTTGRVHAILRSPSAPLKGYSTYVCPQQRLVYCAENSRRGALLAWSFDSIVGCEGGAVLPPGQECEIADGFWEGAALEAKPSCTESGSEENASPAVLCSVAIDAPLGCFLCRGYEDGTIEVVDLVSDTPTRVLQAHQGPVTCVLAVDISVYKDSPLMGNGVLLFSGGADGWVKVWGVRNGSLIMAYESHAVGGVGRLSRYHTYDTNLRYAPHADAEAAAAAAAGSPTLSDEEDGRPWECELDFMVFSVGREDHCVCSYRFDGDLLDACVGYRGHDSAVVDVYRSPWCQVNDFVVVKTQTHQVYVWGATSGQLHNVLEAGSGMALLQNRGLYLDCQTALLRPPLCTATRSSQIVLDMCDSPHLSLNVLLLDLKYLSLRQRRGFSQLASSSPSPSPSSSPRARSRQGGRSPRSPPGDGSELPSCVRMLTYLHDWGVDQSVDEVLSTQLGLTPPKVFTSFGLVGAPILPDRPPFSLTVLFPRQSLPPPLAVSADVSKASDSHSSCPLPAVESLGGRWSVSSFLSAFHSLALNTVFMALLSSGPPSCQAVFSRLVAQYTVILPQVSQKGVFCEPALRILTRYALNEFEGVHVAARVLLQGVMERMPADRRHAIVSKYVARLPATNSAASVVRMDAAASEGDAVATVGDSNSGKSTPHPPSVIRVDSTQLKRNSDLLNALTMCLIKIEHGSLGEYERACAPALLNALLTVLYTCQGQVRRKCIAPALAADLLGKVVVAWRHFIPEISTTMRCLLRLSGTPHSILSSSARRALIRVAYAEPGAFVQCMGAQAIRPNLSDRWRCSAVMALVSFMQKHPLVLANHLAHTVQTIIRCLDPSEPTLRRALLQSSTTALHMLVRQYPMVSFHQKSQLFAVGTGQLSHCVIILYDLRTATKWRILEGHTGSVTALAFDDKGQKLVSYSALDETPCLRLWKVGSGGLLSNLLGVHGSCQRTMQVPRLDKAADMKDVLANVSLTWPAAHSVKLVREDGSLCRFTL